MSANTTPPVVARDKPHLREHPGLVAGAAGANVAGVFTTFLSPVLAILFAEELRFGMHEWSSCSRPSIG